MKNSAKYILAGVAALSIVGCLRTPRAVAASSTPLEGRPYDVIGAAYAQSRQSFILGFIPLQTKGELIQETINTAARKAGGDALIDVSVETQLKEYVLFTTFVTEVRGKAIKFNGSK